MDGDFPCLLLPPRCKVGVNPRGIPGVGDRECQHTLIPNDTQSRPAQPFHGSSPPVTCAYLSVVPLLFPSLLQFGWRFSAQSWDGWCMVWLLGGKGPQRRVRGFWLVLLSALSSPCCVTCPMSLALSDQFPQLQNGTRTIHFASLSYRVLVLNGIRARRVLGGRGA